MTPRHLRFIQLFLLVAIISLSACDNSRVSQPSKPKQPINTIETLLEQARSLPSPQAEAALLQATALLHDQQRYSEALQILESINTRSLPADLSADAILQTARLALVQQNPEIALNILNSDQMGILSIAPELSGKRLNEISLLRAEAWEFAGNFLAAARERIFVAPLLNTSEYQHNQEQIWFNLTALPTETLAALRLTAAFPETKGWLDLAWLYKAFQDDLDQQIRLIKQWQHQYANHPAAQQLPQSLSVLTQLAADRPTKIAVLLPQRGKYSPAARAIESGFMAAHFAAMKNRTLQAGETHPTIRFYDSTNTQQFLATYQQAIADGAQLIIGPLQKENVTQLQSIPDGPIVPTIALNYGDEQLATIKNLYQFGLSAEDEAKQVAQHAMRYEYTNAAILYPQSEWGERVFNAFNSRWNELGGQTLAGVAFNAQGNLSNAIKEMLLIEESEARTRELKRILGLAFESQPRRRHDIDFIYVVAPPKQARQLKPLFDFHYAADLPILASSQIYSGEHNTELDRDLNGIEFCDIPWFFGEQSEAKKLLTKAWPTADSRYGRLNALGVDAYRLLSRIQILVAVPDSKIYGATGTLTLTSNNHIQRELSWYQMVSGTPKPLPQTVNLSDESQGSEADGDIDETTIKESGAGSREISLPIFGGSQT